MRAASILALLLVGCAVRADLRAKPDAVCAGRAVRLTWDASHSGELSADPADPALGEVSASGQKMVHPRVTTTYHLRASSGLGSATSDAKVTVVSPPAQPSPIRGEISDEGGGCAPGKLWVTARVAPDAWDARLRIDQVLSADGRSYRVQHAATMAEVTPDEPSFALRDLPPAGAWKLETPLRPGESCGATAPESLAVAVTFVCAD